MRAIIFLVAGAALAQTPNPRPAFEAAFIKVNTADNNSSHSHETTGQLVMANQSLKRLIERAYDVKPFQVTGPEWMENIRFDITAKYPEDTKDAVHPVMLRTLLEDRFKLVTHNETKELPGFALVLAKSGLKITPAEKGGGGTSDNSTNNVEDLKVTSIPMGQFADFLARRLGSTVVDHTNAEGVYTFELHWTLDNPNGGPVDRGAGEFAAIQEAIGTLGLHLQAQKVPVQMVVVDQVERMPTEN